MGVYIKGMDMPSRCCECELEASGPVMHECMLLYINDYTNVVRENGRLKNCPLTEVKEPHGRLIDADKIKAAYGEWYTEEGTEEGFIGTVGDLIDLIPTVIEAEGTEE